MLVVLLVRNDASGAVGMLQAGAEGADWQRKSIEAYGGRSLHQWAVMGRYDAVVVAEFDALENAIAFSLASSASGQHVDVLPALTHEGFQAAAEVAVAAQEALAALLPNPVVP